MAIRSTSTTTSKLYSSQSELDWSSKHLLSCFFILGLTEDDMDTYSIDELMDRCEWMFEPHPLESYVQLDGKQRSYDSGFAFGRKQKSWMMLLVRRFWRKRHVSSFEVENNV
jgi:hypothetical protein